MSNIPEFRYALRREGDRKSGPGRRERIQKHWGRERVHCVWECKLLNVAMAEFVSERIKKAGAL